jgi:hypothetical protein
LPDLPPSFREYTIICNIANVLIVYTSQETHHQATLAALDVLAIWLHQVQNSSLIFTSETFVDPLRQRLLITSQENNFCFFEIGHKEAFQQNAFDTPSLSLVFIQPLDLDIKYFLQYLKHPNLNQILLLQPGWLGCLALPGWRSGGKSHSINLSKIFNQFNDWHVQACSIGNLSSVLWGFLSGRAASCNQYALMDRYNARMRRNLVPSRTFRLLPLIKIVRLSKDNSPA